MSPTTASAFAPIAIELAQGSHDWLLWRQQGLGSSDAPAIMGVSPWCTQYQLWLRKTRRIPEPTVNDAMRRGSALEADARREFEWEHGDSYPPTCLIHPEYEFLKASLDGLHASGESILEIKVPGRATHEIALGGAIPDHYLPQLHHQLLVSGAQRVHYWSWQPDSGGVLLTLERNDIALATLLKAELAFWQHITTDTPPSLTDSDTIARSDPEWLAAAYAYCQAKRLLDEAEQLEKAAREALGALADSAKTAGGGVNVTWYERAGQVDYKRAAQELADVLGEAVNWDTYRKPGSYQLRISLKEDKE